MLEKEQIERDLIIAHEMYTKLEKAGRHDAADFYNGQITALKSVLELTYIGLSTLIEEADHGRK